MFPWWRTEIAFLLASIFALPVIAQSVTAAESSSEIVGNLCRQITNPRTRYMLLSQTQGVEDVNNDGVPEVSKDCWSGTMNTPCVEYYDQAGREIVIEQIGFEWKDYWTFGRKPFRYSGRTFFYHSADDHLRMPSYISYITPANREYVMCEFSNTVSATLGDHGARAPKVCRAILNRAAAAKPIDMTQTIGLSSKTLNRRDTVVVGGAHVDIDNDGTAEFIVELLFASGAGRGCDFNYFELLDAEGTRLSTVPNGKRASVLKLQGLEQSGFQGRNCGLVENRLVRFENKTYYEGNFRNDDVMPRTVSILEADKVRKVCTFARAVRTTVKKRFLNLRSIEVLDP